jgi:hypothetical protein
MRGRSAGAAAGCQWQHRQGPGEAVVGRSSYGEPQRHNRPMLIGSWRQRLASFVQIGETKSPRWLAYDFALCKTSRRHSGCASRRRSGDARTPTPQPPIMELWVVCFLSCAFGGVRAFVSSLECSRLEDYNSLKFSPTPLCCRVRRSEK